MRPMEPHTVTTWAEPPWPRIGSVLPPTTRGKCPELSLKDLIPHRRQELYTDNCNKAEKNE